MILYVCMYRVRDDKKRKFFLVVSPFLHKNCKAVENVHDVIANSVSAIIASELNFFFLLLVLPFFTEFHSFVHQNCAHCVFWSHEKKNTFSLLLLLYVLKFIHSCSSSFFSTHIFSAFSSSTLYIVFCKMQQKINIFLLIFK